MKLLLRAKANALSVFIGPSWSRRTGLTALEVVTEALGDRTRGGASAWIGGCASGGVNALGLAARRQHVEVMALLTGAGVVDTEGQALITAARHCREEAVKFFLQQREGKGSLGRAYVNVRELSSGKTALVSAIY